jgi:hypothetical protein
MIRHTKCFPKYISGAVQPEIYAIIDLENKNQNNSKAGVST